MPEGYTTKLDSFAAPSRLVLVTSRSRWVYKSWLVSFIPASQGAVGEEKEKKKNIYKVEGKWVER